LTMPTVLAGWRMSDCPVFDHCGESLARVLIVTRKWYLLLKASGLRRALLAVLRLTVLRLLAILTIIALVRLWLSIPRLLATVTLLGWLLSVLGLLSSVATLVVVVALAVRLALRWVSALVVSVA
jgi:hypothetical protein